MPLQNKMQYGKVKNAAGAFVLADLASVTAAAASAAKEMPDDFRVSITNAPGKDFVSDLDVHVAAGSGEDQRSSEEKGIHGFSEMDADGRAGASRAAIVRPSTETGCRERNESDRKDPIGLT